MSKDPSADQIICAGGLTDMYLVHAYITVSYTHLTLPTSDLIGFQAEKK